MAHHKITAADLDDWLRKPQWQEFAVAFGEVSNKRFEIDTANVRNVFRVTDRGKVIFLGADKAKAIEAYNSAP